MESLHEFFVASAGASAALIGLLFVAISIQTERVFGKAASGDRLASAGSAFFAYSNILFISLGGLLPRLSFGILVAACGFAGGTNIIALLVALWRRGDRRPTRTLLLLVVSLGVYAAECWYGVAIERDPTQLWALDDTTYALVILFATGLARSWEVLGGTDISLVRTLLGHERATPRDDGTTDPADD